MSDKPKPVTPAPVALPDEALEAASAAGTTTLKTTDGTGKSGDPDQPIITGRLYNTK